MLYAIISDLHANESAFRRVLADAKAKGVEEIVCLGEVVGYGPLPDETATLARTVCAKVISGNHDDAVTGRLDAKDFIDLAGDAVRRHREALSPTNLAWLRSLDRTFAGDGFLAAHGDFTDPAQFHYVQDETDAGENFHATDAQLMFVGHTHVPQLFVIGPSGKPHKLAPTDFVVEDGKRYIVNPGSVGYPRDDAGTCRTSYVIYDSAQRAVTFHYLPFAVSSVMQRGRGRKPGTRRKKWLLALLLAPAAIVGTAVCLLAPSREAAEMRQVATTTVIETRTLTIPPGTKAVRANLVVQKGSPAVILRMVQRDGGGQAIKTEEQIVRQRSTKRLPVRRNAASVELTVLKVHVGDGPCLAQFTPSCDP